MTAPLSTAPLWPDPAEGSPVFLLENRGRVERRILERWLEESKPEGRHAVDMIDVRRGRARLEARIAQGDDPLFAPLRVSWFPTKRADGSRRVGLFSALFGDPARAGPAASTLDRSALTRPGGGGRRGTRHARGTSTALARSGRAGCRRGKQPCRICTPTGATRARTRGASCPRQPLQGPPPSPGGHPLAAGFPGRRLAFGRKTRAF